MSEMTKEAFGVMAELGTRRHILGILVRGFDMFLCYFDRAGSIISSRLHLVDDETSFVTAIISFSLCTPTRLGFEPNIVSPSLSSAPTTIRGCYIEVQGRRLMLEEVIHSTDHPYGRGTVVFSARPFSSVIDVAGSAVTEVIVKLSWQVTTQDSEDELLRHAAKCHVEGIIKLHLSSTAARLSDGIRKRVMRSNKYIDRELRIQVLGPRCMPLYRVTDLDDFKAAFISLVKG